MTHSRLFLLGSGLLFLTACGAPKSAELTDLLKNPLYAERYYEAQTDHMVNLLIGSGELLKDPAIKKAIDDTRLEGIANARTAADLQAKGKIGPIMSDTEEARGEVLLLDNTLYLGPEFELEPGVDVHMYLSSVLDPREAAFPDDTAIDIGPVHGTFDAGVYHLNLTAQQTENARVFVIYDRALQYILGFAQLSSR